MKRDDLDEEEAWDGMIFVLAMLAATVLIIALSYPARYIADCTDHFGAVDCAKAWAGWEDYPNSAYSI